MHAQEGRIKVIGLMYTYLSARGYVEYIPSRGFRPLFHQKDVS